MSGGTPVAEALRSELSQRSVGDIRHAQPRPPLRHRARKWFGKHGGVGFGILVIGMLYAPLALLVLFSFNDSIVCSFPWRGFTLRWYSEAVSNGNVLSALKNSVLVASIVAPVSLILGTLAAYPITRFHFRFKGAVSGLIAAPIAVPWEITGVAALIYFVRVLHMSPSKTTVILAQIVVTIPLVMLIMAASLARFQRVLEEAARDLGASRLQVFRYIILPHVAPSLIASGLLAFSWSINNFEISFFNGGFDLLMPVWAYSTLRHAVNLPIVNAVGTLVSAAEVLLIACAYVIATSRSGARTAKEKMEVFMGEVG